MEWGPFQAASVSGSAAGGITVTSSGILPLIISGPGLSINAGKFRYLKIKMSSDKSYLIARLLFRKAGTKEFLVSDSFDFVTAQKDRPYTYIIDLNRQKAWRGSIEQLMFCPGNARGKMTIDDFSFIEPSAGAFFSSAMQEFSAFEEPQLYSINLFFGPRIKGISVNIFLFIAIIVISLAFVAAGYRKTGNIAKVFRDASGKLIIISVAIWMMYDLRFMWDQARLMMLDSQLYSGKTLQEKQALVTYSDYYDYLMFCDKHIPKGGSFSVIHPDYYFFTEKAVYYLYPTYYSMNSDNVMIYDPQYSLDIEETAADLMRQGYRIAATYKKGEYLLKK